MKKLLSLLIVLIIFGSSVINAECLGKNKLFGSGVELYNEVFNENAEEKSNDNYIPYYFNDNSIEKQFKPGEVLVLLSKEYSNNPTGLSKEDFPELSIEEIYDVFKVEDLDNAPVDREKYRQIVCIVLTEKTKEAVIDGIKAIKRNELVEDSFPNYIQKIESCNSPNEFNYLSAFDKSALTMINAESAWNITTGSSNVKIGVLDLSFSSHPDLNDNIADKKNFSNNPLIDDNVFNPDNDHGVQMSGILGAKGNNGFGAVGVNWDASIYCARIADSFYNTNDNILCNAFNWMTNNGIKFINWSNSLNVSSCLYNIMSMYKGLICVSADNKGLDIDNDLEYSNRLCTVDLDNVICVAALNAYGTGLTNYSNYGQYSVDIAAPGTNTYTTRYTSSYENVEFGGTSAATAYVTGVAALISSRYPELTYMQIKEAILNSAISVYSLNGLCVTGGRLDAYNALQYADTIRTIKTVSGDYNGDGYSDIAKIVRVSSTHTQFFVQLSNGSSFGDQVIWFENSSYSTDSIGLRITSGDYNGDGKDDLAVIYKYDSGVVKVFTYLSTGTSFGSSSDWLTWSGDMSYVGDRIVSGDYNGDGYDDICILYGPALGGTVLAYVLTSTGNSFSVSVWYTWNAALSCVDRRIVSGDFSGDSKDDVAIMFVYPNNDIKIFVFVSTGLSFSLSNWFDWSADPSCIENRIVSGDFNGDGKDDISVIFCYPNNDIKFFTFFSTGSGFVRYNWCDWNGSMICVGNRISSGDYNYDGYDDISVIYSYNTGRTKIFVFLSTGSSFVRAEWYDWNN